MANHIAPPSANSDPGEGCGRLTLAKIRCRGRLRLLLAFIIAESAGEAGSRKRNRIHPLLEFLSQICLALPITTR